MLRPSLSEILEIIQKKGVCADDSFESMRNSIVNNKIKISQNSIHSIIQARKISISPTNNNPIIFEKNEKETHSLMDIKYKQDDLIEDPIENVSPEESITKKPYQRQISINTTGLDLNFNKKNTPHSKESSNSTKSNIPTDKVRQKTFSFANSIFDPKSPNSPNRSILFSDFLVKRLGDAKFQKMKNLIESSSNPFSLIEENKILISEIIGEENMDCVKIFKFLISSVVTPSGAEIKEKGKITSNLFQINSQKKIEEEEKR